MVVDMPLISAVRTQRQASMIYRVSSRTAWTIQKNHLVYDAPPPPPKKLVKHHHALDIRLNQKNCEVHIF